MGSSYFRVHEPAPKFASPEQKAGQGWRSGGREGRERESREGELEGLAVPSATVFLPVGRPSLLLPYKDCQLSRDRQDSTPPSPQELGRGRVQRLGSLLPVHPKKRCIALAFPLQRSSLPGEDNSSRGNTQAGAALVSGGAGADLPAGLRPIPDPAWPGLLSLLPPPALRLLRIPWGTGCGGWALAGPRVRIALVPRLQMWHGVRGVLVRHLLA